MDTLTRATSSYLTVDDTLSTITSDLEAASLTVQTLIDLAQRAIASEELGVETLIQAAARYAADLPSIVRRLALINQKNKAASSSGGSK